MQGLTDISRTFRPADRYPRASFTAISTIVIPISTSSTRHAEGRANSGEASRAPYPSAVNHTTDPSAAPTANHHGCPVPLASDPSSRTVSR